MKKYLVIYLLLAGGFFASAQQGVFEPGRDYRDGPYDKENAINRKPIPYTHLRQADVMWEKRVWRSVNIKEKTNQQLYYPILPNETRVSLVQAIVKGILKGEIYAFKDDEFVEHYEVTDFRSSMFSASYTVDATSYDSLGNAVYLIDTIPADSTWFYENFCSLDIKEDWFFDNQKSTLEARIIGMGFGFLQKGKESLGCIPMFYVYFPSCRPLFARHEVFNPRNDSERRTFEDVFWKRQFASRVTKESNVFDRNIEKYTKGLDALLESDRIKGDIFRFEHDLWQF
jgi:gliding motility associated protien GldN